MGVGVAHRRHRNLQNQRLNAREEFKAGKKLLLEEMKREILQ